MILEKEDEKNDVNEDLVNLGIWKAEDFVEQAQDADDEKSEDDWSIKTVEEAEEENHNEFPVTPPPTPPPPPRKETPPYMKTLPIGDTPDIEISSSSESEASFIYSIYASQFDEYESDVFGSRLQENLFFLPSIYSDAGDSDMFYCVPRSTVSQHPSSDYFHKSKRGKKRRKKTDNDNTDQTAGKVKRCKTLKELNEQFVQAAMMKFAVRDAAIIQYGGATKAFRLRMAKLGKDPKKRDNEINEKIERKIRKRLRRKKKTDELTRQNVEKLPNISKAAKVLRWITIHKKGENKDLNVVYENGWMGNDDLGKSMRLREGMGEQGLKKRASLGLKSIEGDEDEVVNEGRQGIKYELEKEDTLLERGSKRGENEQVGGRRKKKLRKKRKRWQKDHTSKKNEDGSEESFVIVKHWQLEKKQLPKDNDEIDQGNDDDDYDYDDIEDFSPQSDHSSDKKKQQQLQSDDADSDVSIIPPDSPVSQRKQQPRFPTPDTEPEAEPEPIEEEEEKDEVARTPVSDERKRKNEAAMNWKKLKPGKIFSILMSKYFFSFDQGRMIMIMIVMSPRSTS